MVGPFTRGRAHAMDEGPVVTTEETRRHGGFAGAGSRWDRLWLWIDCPAPATFTRARATVLPGAARVATAACFSTEPGVFTRAAAVPSPASVIRTAARRRGVHLPGPVVTRVRDWNGEGNPPLAKTIPMPGRAPDAGGHRTRTRETVRRRPWATRTSGAARAARPARRVRTRDRPCRTRRSAASEGFPASSPRFVFPRSARARSHSHQQPDPMSHPRTSAAYGSITRDEFQAA